MALPREFCIGFFLYTRIRIYYRYQRVLEKAIKSGYSYRSVPEQHTEHYLFGTVLNCENRMVCYMRAFSFIEDQNYNILQGQSLVPAVFLQS